jgi:hypothetical protein
MQDKVASITKQEITVGLEQLVEGERRQLQARWQLSATLQRDTISSGPGTRRLGLSQHWRTTAGQAGSGLAARLARRSL